MASVPDFRAAQVIINSNTVIAAGLGKRVLAGDEWIVQAGISLTVDGLLIVDGILTVEGLLQNNGSITNNGTINVAADFNNNGNAINYGLLRVDGSLVNSAELKNLVTGMIVTFGLGRIENSGRVWNRSNVYIVAGHFENLTGGEVQNRQFAEFHNGDTVENSGLFENRGLVENLLYFNNLAGGELVNFADAAIVNEAEFSNADSLQNFGAFTNEVDATFTNEAGEVLNWGSGNFINKGDVWNVKNILTGDYASFLSIGFLYNQDAAFIYNDDVSVLANNAGGSFRSDGDIENWGGMWNNGFFTTNGRFNNDEGFMMNFCAGVMVNNGRVDNHYPGEILNGGSITNNGTWSGDQPVPYACP